MLDILRKNAQSVVVQVIVVVIAVVLATNRISQQFSGGR